MSVRVRATDPTVQYRYYVRCANYLLDVHSVVPFLVLSFFVPLAS